MALTHIDGALLREMLLSGTSLLQRNKDDINALNVFPVPDGDTGTNMLLTMQSAIKEVQKLGDTSSLKDVGEAMSRGALKGARGNSGVILSQILRGFYQSCKDGNDVDAKGFARALKGSTDTAYKAVMKPREGTMLTVCRAVSDEAQKVATQSDDLLEIMQRCLKAGYTTLDRTPEMLDVLKHAGVVDSGGKGLLTILDGFYRAMQGLQTEDLPEAEIAAPAAVPPSAAGASQEHIEFGYCTEFIITNLKPGLKDEDVTKLHQQLDEMGDSIVLVRDDDIIKVHVHSNRPGLVLEYAMACGDLINLKIDNMREQHSHLLEIEATNTGSSAAPEVEEQEYALVSVVSGKGFEKIFRDLGVQGFVSGGQTMNPSTDDIVEAVRSVHAKTVYVLPNNPNIILAARQAVDLVECRVIVVPSKTLPQGLAAVLAFNPEAGVEENEQAMTEALKTVQTGQVTYAVRDTEFDGITIRQGDIMGISNGHICVTGQQPEQVALELLTQMADEDSEIITVFYGQDVSEEKAGELAARLEETFPDLDVECHSGGQPVYYYILSVE